MPGAPTGGSATDCDRFLWTYWPGCQFWDRPQQNFLGVMAQDRGLYTETAYPGRQAF